MRFCAHCLPTAHLSDETIDAEAGAGQGMIAMQA
jgi:hypothetical protein